MFSIFYKRLTLIFFKFFRNFVGCDCDIGGAVTNVCKKSEGQCQCRQNIIGRQCNRCNFKDL